MFNPDMGNTDESRNVLSANIRAKMTGMTETMLAEKSQVSQSTIHRIINNAVSARIDNVFAIAKALGMEPWQLLVPGWDAEQSKAWSAPAPIQERRGGIDRRSRTR